ncbi:hypothetical protein E6H18_08315 [Candidatus Bathyarchaeota archaeon]|nr:MAG: hypothetical protein E6H20_09830 [Candidatus Bathyarchaeota archaeon]TMI55998.1 MAG: hypothetical protein E6H18_08315 [Candidatus Bathyarchaeota archaeon]
MTAQRSTVSVPEAVREILTRNCPIYQCLKMKLMNFHSLAELIQPQVKQMSGRGNNQHASRNDQAILRHPIQHEEP